MRPIRLFLGLAVAIGLAPGTFVRAPVEEQPALRGPIRIEPLAAMSMGTGPMRMGPLELEGAWHLESRDSRFGGYSGLVATDGPWLVAVSDTGRLLMIRIEEGRPVAAKLKRIRREIYDGERTAKINADIESLTRDPASGTVWAGYEARNAIERLSPEFRPQIRVQPPAMRGWSGNGGPEALARLPDGRFIAISESAESWSGTRHPALLFPDDPTAGVEPVEFRFAAPQDYRPVDMVATPEGKVLILLRRWRFGLPPTFEGAIMLADPEQIEPGEIWRGRMLARIEPPAPTDNYEGIALAPDGETVWLISDDNLMDYQRTLLLKLRWDRPRSPETQRAHR